MAERTIELDTPVITDETAEALRAATERAERAEAELVKLKTHPQAASAAAPATGSSLPATSAPNHTPAEPHARLETPAEEGNLFEGQEPSPDAGPASETAAARLERDAARDAAANSAPAQASSERGKHVTDGADDAVHTDALKQPPTPSTAANATGNDDATAVTERGSADRATAEDDGVDELRKDPMMAHLLNSLDAGTDVGHYGRLVFAMVARHFLPHPQVIAWMTKDSDFSAEQAQQMLHQVEGRDYNPPRRERLLQWQKEQEFQFMNVHDPDSGNLYRNLEFPKEVYDHIGHYQEAKASE